MSSRNYTAALFIMYVYFKCIPNTGIVLYDCGMIKSFI